MTPLFEAMYIFNHGSFKTRLLNMSKDCHTDILLFEINKDLGCEKCFQRPTLSALFPLQMNVQFYCNFQRKIVVIRNSKSIYNKVQHLQRFQYWTQTWNNWSMVDIHEKNVLFLYLPVDSPSVLPKYSFFRQLAVWLAICLPLPLLGWYSAIGKSVTANDNVFTNEKKHLIRSYSQK